MLKALIKSLENKNLPHNSLNPRPHSTAHLEKSHLFLKLTCLPKRIHVDSNCVNKENLKAFKDDTEEVERMLKVINPWRTNP
jgi:hypothetical protein